jgi:ribosomal protein S18 acetylase RimI-like enzyme
MHIGPMLESDLDAVLAVQAACYPPAMQEAGDVVLGRMRAAPDTVLVARAADGVAGYLFAYPSRRGKVTPLGGAFALPRDADTLYLHDLAVAPRAAGRGVARRLVARLLEHGAGCGLAHSALVSVQNTRRFWESLGYACSPVEAGALAGYPPGASYMTRTL